MTVKVAQAIARAMKAEGVEILFGYPVNPILEAAAELDIRTVIVRQERTGLHMADAVSRLSSGKKLGVFVMQHGPGTENAFGGVAQAFGESVPILVIPMGYARADAHVYPNFSSTLNFQHVTKWCEPLTTAKSVGAVMRRAFTQLRTGRGGPVLVEVPYDLMGAEVDEAAWNYQAAPTVRCGPDPADIAQVAEMLRSAERPVVYAGQGVHYAEAWPELKTLAEQLAIPVTTSLQGKSAFPENHPLSLGSGGRTVPRAVHEYLQEADVILGVGCSFTSTFFGITFPEGKQIIQATLDPRDLNKDVPIAKAVLGDAKLTLAALVEAIGNGVNTAADRRRETVPSRIREIKTAWLEEWKPKLTCDEAPICPYRVIWDLMHTVDTSKTIITHDAGSPRDQMSPFWESVEPLSYIGWGKTTQLGYGLGLAMGAKLAHPDRLCINVWGDAAIGFTGMDFETAAREQIPILSILFNNFSMAIEIPIMPISTEKYGATNISGNYADFAVALGGYGERVTEPSEILPALERGIRSTEEGRPALLEFITNQELSLSRYG